MAGNRIPLIKHTPGIPGPAGSPETPSLGGPTACEPEPHRRLVAGEENPSRAIALPRSGGALRPRPLEAANEARRLLREVGVGTQYSIWERLLDALKELFTAGLAETRLMNDDRFWRRLAERVSVLPPDSPAISALFEQMPWSLSDNFARYLYETRGRDWIDRLGLEARKRILQSVREGWISPADRRLYDAIEGNVRDEDLRRDLVALEDPVQRAAMRERFQRLLADGSGYAASFGDRLIPVAEPALKSSWLVDLAYWNTDRVVENASKPEAVAAAMAPPLVCGPDGQPVHFETVVYRPGLANKGPSASHLFRVAQHADHVVVAHTQHDVTPDSKLRELTEYKGAPVPAGLRGKIYAIGKPDDVLQSYRAGTGTFISQLDELMRRGPAFGIDIENITAFAYSQGNIETALARLVLAAHGEPHVIDRHIGLAPPMRGSLVVDNTGSGLLGALASGHEGRQALEDLDPDVVGAMLPEFMRTTVDVAFLGDMETGADAGVAEMMLRLLRPMTEEGLVRDVGDGLVDYRSADFARTVQISNRALDHVALVATPPDDLLAIIPPATSDSVRVLEKLAEGAGDG